MTTRSHPVDVPAPAAPSPAKPPVAAPMASVCAVVLALGLIGAGAVAVRDVLVTTGAVAGSSWTVAGLARLDGLTAPGWMLPGGLARGVLGFVMLLVAVAPRRRTHRPARRSRRTGSPTTR